MSKITAHDVRAALKKHYAQPNYGIVFEVAASTGYSANRRLDAVAMGLWPSRGLTLYGIEIKVSRSDWRREVEQPQKAEELAKYCDYFYVAAPRGVVPLAEVPDAWGLLELSDDKIAETKKPTKTEAIEIGRPFLAAVFRAASRGIDPESVDAMVATAMRPATDALNKQREEFNKLVDEAAKRRHSQDSSAAEKWRRLVQSLGSSDSEWMNDQKVIDAVRIVCSTGVTETFRGVRHVHGELLKAAEGIEREAAALGIDVRADKRDAA